MERSEEAAGRNEALFRAANERINDKVRELGFAGRLPFLCECEEPRCTAIVPLTHDEYERARGDGRTFLLAPGHESRNAQLIETNERFTIVQKQGVEAEIAEKSDPRSPA